MRQAACIGTTCINFAECLADILGKLASTTATTAVQRACEIADEYGAHPLLRGKGALLRGIPDSPKYVLAQFDDHDTIGKLAFRWAKYPAADFVLDEENSHGKN